MLNGADVYLVHSPSRWLRTLIQRHYLGARRHAGLLRSIAHPLPTRTFLLQVPLHRRPTSPTKSGVDVSNFEGQAWRMSRRML